MKKKILFSLILSMIFIAGFPQEKSGNDEKHEGREEQTEKMVNSRDFVFQARRALPSRGSAIDLTTNQNFVKFEPDLIESYMPFFGRAYSGVGYGGDSGLHFKGQPEEYTIEKKRGSWQVNAKVRGEADVFRIFLAVRKSGSARLTISSNNRESMSFTGEIRDKLP